jgi:thiamine-phosphate pyrophosphorylase
MTALPYPLVYLITDGSAADQSFHIDRPHILKNIRAAVDDGVSLIQIREKHLSARLLTELVTEAVQITNGSPARLLVNDRADIAVAAGADGVHLAATSLPAGVVRRHFPATLIIGVSAHTADDVRAAAYQGADLAVFGPVYETPGKGPAAGIEALSQACKKTWPFPVLALGGVDRSNWRTVIEAGAAGFAAIRSLNQPDSRREIMEGIKNEFRDK